MPKVISSLIKNKGIRGQGSGESDSRSSIKSFRDLIVWKKAMEFIIIIYRISREFPKEESYGLTNQIRRAAVSIASNIAEGHSRDSKAEFRHFLSYSKGSLAEVETQLLIAQGLDYVTAEDLIPAYELREEISKMIYTLSKKLA